MKNRLSMLFRSYAWIVIFPVVIAGAVFFIMRGGALRDETTASTTAKYQGKKILFIDSYHEGYEWSDGVTKGLKSKLDGTGVELNIVRMDTKRNPDETFKRSAGEKAKLEIERFAPDVVIACDDNAFKYVVMPFYRDARLPIVFCGLNWDASIYGAPYANTTGMVEVTYGKRLIEQLSVYAKGSRVGYLSADSETDRAFADFYDRLFGIKFAETRYVNTMAEWENAFDAMQRKVDILVFGNNAGITGWNDARAASFAAEHTRIPVGVTGAWLMPVALIGLTEVPEEQGEWSAMRALDILNGAKPSDIPLVTNQRGEVFLNLTIAAKLGITFSPHLIKNARIVR